MDLLRRYLQAVGTYLPKSQQDDILKELGENLRSQMEDNEDEVAAILKKHGHPMFVAAHYRQTRHLIGSTLFPVYWFVMKIILGIVGFGYSISALVLIAQRKRDSGGPRNDLQLRRGGAADIRVGDDHFCHAGHRQQQIPFAGKGDQGLERQI